MKFLDWLTSRSSAAPSRAPRADAGGGAVFNGLDDPALLAYIRQGGQRGQQALFNTTAFRCVDLIASVMGALPFRPMKKTPDGSLVEAEDHPLYEVLNGQANAYQTGAEFRQLMQTWALAEGDAIARIVRSSNRIVGLLPIQGATCRLNQYAEPVYSGPAGDMPASEIFHLRGLSLNGINGLSRVRMAGRAIGLSKEAEDAAVNIFRAGISPGGMLKHQKILSEEAHNRLKKDMDERYAGTTGAGRWFLLEEGMEATPFQPNGRDSQLMERSKHQVEEIARVFGGVPRPLLCVDDTTWGSGVEQLGILFARFTLAPWFKAWEARGRMSLLTPVERKTYTLDFDDGELLRGSMKDLGDFLAKVVGGKTNNSVLTQNEGRAMLGAGRHPEGDRLTFISGDSSDVPAQTA